MSDPKNIVWILACHCTYNGTKPSHIFNETKYGLESFQKWNSHIQLFHDHLRRASQLLEAFPDSSLILSGGYSRPGAKRSEARSYEVMAKHLGIKLPKKRIYKEKQARDSMENLLLSCGLAASTPELTNVHYFGGIGFEFKRVRFMTHASVLGLQNVDGPGTPTAPGFAGFFYVGVNQVLDMEGARRGEENTRNAFADSWHGIDGPLLEKRLKRMTARSRRPRYRKRIKGAKWSRLREALKINKASW